MRTADEELPFTLIIVKHDGLRPPLRHQLETVSGIWTPATTPHGKRDLQGLWTNVTCGLDARIS